MCHVRLICWTQESTSKHTGCPSPAQLWGSCGLGSGGTLWPLLALRSGWDDSGCSQRQIRDMDFKNDKEQCFEERSWFHVHREPLSRPPASLHSMYHPLLLALFSELSVGARPTSPWLWQIHCFPLFSISVVGPTTSPWASNTTLALCGLLFHKPQMFTLMFTDTIVQILSGFSFRYCWIDIFWGEGIKYRK